MRKIAAMEGLVGGSIGYAIGPPRHVGNAFCPSATATASRAKRRVESIVGRGETSGVMSSGISVQLRATESQP